MKKLLMIAALVSPFVVNSVAKAQDDADKGAKKTTTKKMKKTKKGADGSSATTEKTEKTEKTDAPAATP